MNKQKYSDFARLCVDELNVLQDKYRKDFDIDAYENWFYNQSTALLTFWTTGGKEVNFKYLEVGKLSKQPKHGNGPGTMSTHSILLNKTFTLSKNLVKRQAIPN